MTEKDQAQERFSATDAENKGKGQCASCALFDGWPCSTVKADDFPLYVGNRKKCPKLSPID